MNFTFSDLELAKITLGRNQDTPSGHTQSLCKLRTSNLSSIKRNGLDTNDTRFLSVTLN